MVQVFAAGNEGTSYGIDSVRTPGDAPDQITVGATNCSMQHRQLLQPRAGDMVHRPGLQRRPDPPGKLKPTISAPGDGTVSHNICSGYATLSGTSMATPHSPARWP